MAKYVYIKNGCTAEREIDFDTLKAEPLCTCIGLVTNKFIDRYFGGFYWTSICHFHNNNLSTVTCNFHASMDNYNMKKWQKTRCENR